MVKLSARMPTLPEAVMLQRVIAPGVLAALDGARSSLHRPQDLRVLDRRHLLSHHLHLLRRLCHRRLLRRRILWLLRRRRLRQLELQQLSTEASGGLPRMDGAVGADALIRSEFM